MIAPHTFAAKWKGEPLIRVPASLLDGINIPEASRQFLIQAGLPRRWRFLSFDHLTEGLPLLSDILIHQDSANGDYRVLGDVIPDWSETPTAYLCIEEGNVGRVVIGEPDNFWLMNSSIPHFAASLLAYEVFSVAFTEACKDARLDEYESVEALLDQCKQQLKRIDPDAMKEIYFDTTIEGDYWPIFLERFWG